MKQQVKKLLLTTSVALLVAPISAYAHPGRTDANGGHTCRTNCEKWGLQYGEYHYHNKPASNSGTTSPAPSQNNNGAVEAKNKQKHSVRLRQRNKELQKNNVKQRKRDSALQKNSAK